MAKEIKYGNQFNKFHGAATRWCLRNADAVLISSQSYKNIILKLAPSANVYLIHHTINDSLYDIDIPEKSNRVVTALFAGNFTRTLKGIDLFDKVAFEMTDKYKFEICDGIPHDKMIEIFKTSKVYCQLSHTESFGISLVEAMACGCVPIVVDRDSLPQLIGNSGIVIPHGDEAALIKAIQVAMTMDGNKARERAKLYNSDHRMELLSQIMENDIVSIVIPSYNSAKWLPDTIKSVQDQTYKNVEIIVVDDGSTDNTKEVVESIHDPRIRYVPNIINRGECRSSRIGFSLARGKYICRLSSDDMYANENKIKHQVQYMDETGVDWSYNSINCIGESFNSSITAETYWMVLPTRYGHKILQLFDNYILMFPRIAFIRLFYGNPVNSSTLMFRATSYKIGDKWSNIHRTDCDGLLLFSMLLRGTRGGSIREMGSFYRTHPNQMSYNPIYIAEMKVIRREIIEKLYKGDYPIWLKMLVRILGVSK